jgi:hypothetical protein
MTTNSRSAAFRRLWRKHDLAIVGAVFFVLVVLSTLLAPLLRP